MALVMELVLRVGSFSPNLRLALSTGFMGGLTTYSAFNFETTKLASDGGAWRAVLYVGMTLIGCLLAGVLGMSLARRMS
jgi:CrcB protein